MAHWFKKTSNIIFRNIKLARLSSTNNTNAAAGRQIKNKATHRFLWAGATATSLGIFVIYAANNGREDEKPKKKVVVLGSGWGAVSFLKSLTPGEYEVSVVSPENYFLFTPLLPSVTVGTVEARSITEPIRKILAKRHKHGAKFYEGNCMEIDIEGNKVKCRDLSGEFKKRLIIKVKKTIQQPQTCQHSCFGRESGDFKSKFSPPIRFLFYFTISRLFHKNNQFFRKR